MELQPRTGLVRPTLKISVLLINRPLDPRSPSPSDGQRRHLRGLVILFRIRYTVAVIRTIPTIMTAHSPAAGDLVLAAASRLSQPSRMGT